MSFIGEDEISAIKGRVQHGKTQLFGYEKDFFLSENKLSNKIFSCRLMITFKCEKFDTNNV